MACGAGTVSPLLPLTAPAVDGSDNDPAPGKASGSTRASGGTGPRKGSAAPISPAHSWQCPTWAQARCRASGRKAPTASDAPNIEFGNLRIDRAAHRVWVEGAEVELTALEFKLLVTLYDRRNRVQSRSVLLDDVWSVSGENATRTVDTHVKRLREKLGPVGSYIETIRGIGYRFGGAPPKQPP